MRQSPITTEMRASKITGATWTIKVTETNYSSDSKQSGLLLNKTLKPIRSIYNGTEKVAVIMKDVDSNDKFWVDIYGGKLNFKGVEFKPCIQTGIQDMPWATTDWGKKTNVICKKYEVTA